MYQNWTFKKVYAAKMKKSVFCIWEKSLYGYTFMVYAYGVRLWCTLYGVRCMVYALW
jgi:hypothetical protein